MWESLFVGVLVASGWLCRNIIVTEMLFQTNLQSTAEERGAVRSFDPGHPSNSPILHNMKDYPYPEKKNNVPKKKDDNLM